MPKKGIYSRACQCAGNLLPVIIAFVFNLAVRGDTIAVTTTSLNGPGSFKQALVTANTNPGPNTIVFQITGTPPFTISPTNALDAITAAVTIDGTTQPGYAGKPLIELNGAVSGGTAGLRFNAGASTLRGLAINRFPLGAIVLNSASNVVKGNFIGTDATGLVARGAGTAGNNPSILVNSSGNVIGGTNRGDGNVISAGNGDGIYFLNCSNNVVQGNFIGVNASGTAALGNTNNGIVLYSSGGNLIGGPTPAARNVVSGNRRQRNLFDRQRLGGQRDSGQPHRHGRFGQQRRDDHRRRRHQHHRRAGQPGLQQPDFRRRRRRAYPFKARARPTIRCSAISSARMSTASRRWATPTA